MQTPNTLILGGSGSIGSALARRLIEDGQRVVLAARGEQRLSSVASELGCPWHACDASDAGAVDSLVKSLAGEGLSGVVCCVGSILLKPAHTTSADEFAETLRLNLTTAFNAVRSGAAAMTRTGGSIVLLSSAAARTGLANHEAIAAAKAGVEGLTRSAAATYAGRGLRFNAVAPGLVDTPLAERITRSEKALEHSRRMHPLGRIGRPDDVASAIAWLLSEESDWTTGQVIGIDGGLGRTRAGAS